MTLFIIIILGLIIGSFMNVVIYRLPRGLSIVKPESFCPVCKTSLKYYDNIPILSYIILRGRCRYCKSKISLQYPTVELINTLVFVALYLKFGLSYITIFYMILSFFLLTAAFCDIFTLLDNSTFDTGVIPDMLVYTGIITGLLFTILYQLSFLKNIFSQNFLHFMKYNYDGSMTLMESIIGVTIGFLLLYIPNIIYKLITKRDGIGVGDMKLFAMIGAFLGYKPLIFVLLFSSLIGAIVGIFVVYIKKNRYFPLPFVPFIAFSTYLVIFLKEYIYNFLIQMYGLK